MEITFIASSSSGNCVLLETQDTTIVIDVGISYKRFTNTLNRPIDLDAIFITHEHSDHIIGAGVMSRKTGATVYISELCYNEKQSLFANCKLEFISGGSQIIIKNFKISAFSTKHDSAASLGYVITDLVTNRKFGFLTDTGVITPNIKYALSNCNAYFLESDYDIESLEKFADYDDLLKDRIRSPIGHLSNTQSLKYLTDSINLDNVEWVVFGHLSAKTNSPQILQSQIEQMIPQQYWSKLIINNGNVLHLTL